MSTRTAAQAAYIEDVRHGDGMVWEPVDRPDGTVVMCVESQDTPIVIERDGTVRDADMAEVDEILGGETELERAYREGTGCGGLDADGVKELVELSRGV